MMDTKLQEQTLYYHQVLNIWEGFCKLHKDLFDLTCDEYLTLLSSDIDKLEEMLPSKEEIIARVSELEKDRAKIIEQINSRSLFSDRIERAADLLSAFADLDNKSAIPALKNLNALLIDIIEKIQEQNKKNQLFLNKAMLSLQDVKQGFTGKKTFTTYGADGLTRSLNR
jgi:flagellar biosynthesis/type III secretory pathway chaperone